MKAKDGLPLSSIVRVQKWLVENVPPSGSARPRPHPHLLGSSHSITYGLSLTSSILPIHTGSSEVRPPRKPCMLVYYSSYKLLTNCVCVGTAVDILIFTFWIPTSHSDWKSVFLSAGNGGGIRLAIDLTKNVLEFYVLYK